MSCHSLTLNISEMTKDMPQLKHALLKGVISNDLQVTAKYSMTRSTVNVNVNVTAFMYHAGLITQL